MANLKNVIYLSNEDYLELVTTGTVTINGTTLQYSDDDVYITPDILASATENGLMSAEDKAKLDNLPASAISGSYNDLTNKPTIGNATITIQKNGTNVDSFTTNATSNKSINISVPTKISDLTDDSSFLKKSGGTMTGQLKWQDSTALPRANYGTEAALEYILGIRAFSDGGGTLYEKKSEFLSGYATQTWVNNKGYTTNAGTVTSVGAGTGLSISGTASVNPTVNVASTHKLPTTTEWNAKANTADLGSAAYEDVGTTAGTIPVLDSSGKIPLSLLPSAITGQMVYGGTVTGAGVATLSSSAKTKLNTTSNSITLTNNSTATTGYGSNEGIYYIVSSDGSFASLDLKTGDWLISTGSSWKKIDNTDAIVSINNTTGAISVALESASSSQTGAVAYIDSVNSFTKTPTTRYLHFNAGTTPPSEATFNGNATTSLVTSGSTKYLTASFSGNEVAPTFTGTSTTTGTPVSTETVANSTHTHTLTATGNVSLSGARTLVGSGTNARRRLTITGSFSGTSATTSAPAGTVAVGSSSHTHSVTATGNVGKFTPSGDVEFTIHTSAVDGSVQFIQTVSKSSYTPSGTIVFTSGTAPSLTYDANASNGIKYLEDYTFTGGGAGTTKYMKVKVSNS